MNELINDLTDRTHVAENVVQLLRRSFTEIESRQRNLDLARESVVERMMEIELLRESYEKGLEDLEEKELEFCAFKEGKKRKLALEEEELSVKREELLNDVRLREEKLDEQLVLLREQIQRLEVDQRTMQCRMHEKLKEIKIQEESLISARESVSEREREVEESIRKLDKRVRAVEERENAINFTVETKIREIDLKEEQLSLKWHEFLKEVKLADDKLKNWFSQKVELAEYKLETMSGKIDERFKKIESRESVVWESVEATVKQADLIRDLLEKELSEFEKMKREYDSFPEEKMLELDIKEEKLNAMSRQLVEDAKSRDEELTNQEKLGSQLLERLELEKDKLEDLNKMVCEWFKQIGLKEIELKSLSDWVETKMDEVDSKGIQLEEKENSLLTREENLISRKNEIQQKLTELDMKEKNLESWQKELKLKKKNLRAFQNKLNLKKKDLRSWKNELKIKQREVDSAEELNERRLGEIDRKEKNINSLKEFTSKCFKEHVAIKKQLLLEKELVEKRARDFDLDESADLKFVLRMDGKTLQMFLNDPAKDLEAMGDEIFKVLHLSSDPAKLVLDAMVGFYPPRLRKGDVEHDVRRICIILLEQLFRMSKKIEPCIKEEATELASSWKSKMGSNGENPLEILGFLHLITAYNLVSYFDKNEVLSFLMMVAQHRQRPELCRVLGFADSFTD